LHHGLSLMHFYPVADTNRFYLTPLQQIFTNESVFRYQQF